MYRLNKTWAMLGILGLVCGFGCSQKTPLQKETVTVSWQHGALSFDEFLRSMPMSYEAKIRIKGGGNYNAYGKVTVVNHHAKPIVIRGQKPLIQFTNNYYLPNNEGYSSRFHTPWWGQKQDVEVLPNDSLQFYLVFTQEVNDKQPKFFVDSLDYVLHYRLMPATKEANKKDQNKYVELVLKREPDGSYSMHPKAEAKEKEEDETNTSAITVTKKLQKEAFADFVAHFPELTIKESHKKTCFPHENHLPDSNELIKEIYMKQFVNRCLNAYDEGEDSLHHFVKLKTTLFGLQGQYLGKIPYPDANVTVLLVRLFDPAYFYTSYKRNYNLLCFFDSQTGDALGYDIVSGVLKKSHESHHFGGRLHLKNQQLIVEQTSGYDTLPNRYHGQIYRLHTKAYKGNLYLRKTLSTIALEGETKKIGGVAYRKYCNTEIGYCVDLPSQIFVYNNRRTDEYLSLGEHFISQDQQSFLSVIQKKWFPDRYGKTHPVDLPTYYASERNNFQSNDHLTHHRSKLGKDFCAFEYTIIKQICIYEQHIVNAQGITTLNLTYPISQRWRYVPIIRQLERTFRSGK